MAQVITFAPRPVPAEPEAQETATGEARCLVCRHEWQAVAPLGVHELECPQCGTVKGVWKHFFSRRFGDPDAPHWQCPCGCSMFGVTPYGIYCLNCGRAARPYDTPGASA